MMKYSTLILAVAICGFGAGCFEPSSGTSRQLGNVNYELAFSESKEVLSQYFSIEIANADTGVITCRPSRIDANNERLLGGSNARHLAKMRLSHDQNLITAHLSIAIQRQGNEGYGVSSFRRPSEDDYRGVPDYTPSQREGATTPDQNSIWRTQRQDKSLEVEILSRIREKLHPSIHIRSR